MPARPAARKGDLVKHKGAPDSVILTGSPNIFVDGLPAARMTLDKALHGKDPEAIAQGSGSVFRNGMPAARSTDMVGCKGEIVGGSSTVFIGDGSDGKACSICPGSPAVGSPVNPVVGAKVLSGPEDLDFALPGAMPLVWQRHYSSYVGGAGNKPGLLGFGWRLPFEMHMQLTAKKSVLFDTKNRSITFEPIAPGEIKHSKSEGFWLMRGGVFAEPPADMDFPPKSWGTDPRWSHIPKEWRVDPNYCLCATADRTVWLFAAMDVVPDADTQWMLVAILDVFGRMQKYERYVRDGKHGTLGNHTSHVKGQLHSINDGFGRRYTLHYTQERADRKTGDTGLRLASVSVDHPRSNTELVRYTYLGGNLTRVTDRHGRVTREFSYSAQRIASHRVLGGPRATYTYEHDKPGARVTHHAIEDGLAYTFEYQQAQTVVTDNLGRSTRYAFEGKGSRQQLDQLTDPLGHVTRYHHGLNGHLGQVVNALDQRNTWLRDEDGRIVDASGPDGQHTLSTWDDNGNLKTLTAPGPHGKEQTSHFEHDRYNRLLKTTDPLGQETQYRYADPRAHPSIAELPIEIIDAKGGVKTLEYNVYGQLILYTDCSKRSTKYLYDIWGQLTSVTNANGETLTYTRNSLGQVETITYPDKTQAQYRYGGRGHLAGVIDAEGSTIQYQRDSHGRVLRSIQQGKSGPARTLAYTYDPAERLTRLTNENGAHTHFQYDAGDRLIEEIGFDGRTQRYAYNAIGLLMVSHDCTHAGADAPTLTTTYEYDRANRLVKRHIPARLGQGDSPLFDAVEQRFEYNEASQMVSAITAFAQVRFERDALGRISEESLRCLDFSHSVHQQYDPLGNRTNTKQAFAGEIDYLGYGSGHVHQILLNKTALIDFERDEMHREIGRKLMSGPTPKDAIRQYRRLDLMGRLESSHLEGGPPHPAGGSPLPSAPGSPLPLPHAGEGWGEGRSEGNTPEPTIGGLSRSYHHDLIGQLISIHKPGRQETQFAYDPAHRLIGAFEVQHFEKFHNALSPDKPSITLARQGWEFDPAGNRVEGSHTRRWENNRVQQDAERRFSYDPWGNLAKIAYHAGPKKGMTVMFLYDGLHQLRASQTYDPHQEEDSKVLTTVHYDYDALGRRIQKRQMLEYRDRPNVVVTQEWYGWDGDRLVTTQTRDRVTSTVYEPNSFVPLLRVDTTRQEITKEDGTKEKQARKDLFFYHCDHIGTPVALIESRSARIVWQVGLDPWGNIKKEYDPYSLPQPIRMQGQHQDPETGLHYNRFRYYDPQTGRYVTQDPIGLGGGANKYCYAAGSPASNIDPDGLLTYMCTQPLHALGALGKLLYSPGANPLYHQFIGIIGKDGTVITGGQERAAGPWGQGTPSKGDATPESGAECKLIEGENACLESCLKGEFSKPRPPYALAASKVTNKGLNCQGWADKTIEKCRSECKSGK